MHKGKLDDFCYYLSSIYLLLLPLMYYIFKITTMTIDGLTMNESTGDLGPNLFGGPYLLNLFQFLKILFDNLGGFPYY